MSKIQFRLAARTDAAGKFNPNAPLEGNEDNMFVDTNLNSDQKDWPRADEVVDLSDLGCLMVVADGMGGMNAGEVASEIAIKTVTEYFSPQHLAGKTFRNSQARCKYMEEVVEAADANIKGDARVNKDHEGMGSTIIMGWLCDGEISLTWCGDSRAYLYRPGKGFWQVSKDHSYVQGLVDDGKITMDEAFDHPYGNIITRSLGDPEKRAKADSKTFPVFEGDIFMLCSDGLSGVLRDHKTYDADGQRIESENLEDIIDAHRNSMAECRDELFAAAERNDWYDNVTAILCEVVKGEPVPADMVEPPVKYPTPKAAHQPAAEPEAAAPSSMNNTSFRIRKKNLPLLIAGLVVLLGAVGFLVWKFTHEDKPSGDSEYFAYCEKKQDVASYRTYVKNFPTGLYIDDAKRWIDNWVKDSTDKANAEKGLVNVEKKPAEDKPAPADKKGKEEPKKREEPKKVDDKPATPSSGEDVETPMPLTPADNNNGLKDGKEGLKESQNGGKAGLKPAEGGNSVGEGLSASGDSEEEVAYNRIRRLIQNRSANLDDYKKYLHVYYEKHPKGNVDHWNEVASAFKIFYTQMISRCKTEDEINNILDKHDELMKYINLNGTTYYDKNLRTIAEDKKKKLSSSRPSMKDKPSVSVTKPQ